MPTETKPTNDYWQNTYKPQLEAAVEYQDFICVELQKHGIVIQNMSSRKYQLRGENLLGLEIKQDLRMHDTGNVYIETHEKSNPDNPEYVLSGIYRDDGSWMYGIGDYSIFYLFSKKTLQRIDNHGPLWLIRPKPTPTSKGFLLSTEKAAAYAELEFDFPEP